MHSPRNARVLLAPLLLAAASIACPLAVAQQPPLAPLQPPSVHGPQRGGGREAQMLSVEFAGGTLGQFVETVKGASSDTINVVVPAEAMNVNVPRLSLKNVSPYMALQALEYISDRKAFAPGFQGGVQPGMMNVNEIQVMDLNRNDPSSNDSSRTFAIVYTKRERGHTAGFDAPGLEQTTQVFSVRDLLATEGKNGIPGLTLDQIVQPLEATLNVEAGEGGGEPAKLMVHRESNLVIVRGTPRQTALVKQVLERLKEDVQLRRGSVMPEREKEELAREMDKQYQVRLDVLEVQRKTEWERLRALRAELEHATTDKNERAAAAVQASLKQAETSVANLDTELLRTKQQQAEVEFEAARQWRSMAAGNTEVQGLREQIEQLRRQIEDMKAAAKTGNPR